ncbi:hypothetical protein R6242_17410 [Iodobacter sp. CM08]|uniref:hypothetical protein n=1 Tax=Iodobacter sp. CM08 TaxID=3085902 RepID=UPI002982B168|nr:hypothetical protein [Iodobacter sp. CM08]MDW5418347.1 hypothetical protein [Iodobacter sp. CM08]
MARVCATVQPKFLLSDKTHRTRPYATLAGQNLASKDQRMVRLGAGIRLRVSASRQERSLADARRVGKKTPDYASCSNKATFALYVDHLR